MNTVLVASPSDIELITQLIDELQERGFKAVRLANLSVVGFLVASQRIAAVVIHEDSVPPEWESVRESIVQIAPATRIIVVGRDEQRTVAEILHALSS